MTYNSVKILEIKTTFVNMCITYNLKNATLMLHGYTKEDLISVFDGDTNFNLSQQSTSTYVLELRDAKCNSITIFGN